VARVRYPAWAKVCTLRHEVKKVLGSPINGTVSQLMKWPERKNITSISEVELQLHIWHDGLNPGKISPSRRHYWKSPNSAASNSVYRMMADRNGRNMLRKINECIVFKALCRILHRTTITELHNKIRFDITYSLRKLF
jgi:hypothetical protein